MESETRIRTGQSTNVMPTGGQLITGSKTFEVFKLKTYGIFCAFLAILTAATGCDISGYYPQFDAIDTNISELPFDPPDDYVPGDNGQSGFALTSVTPSSGPASGGTRVTVEGRGFTDGSTVVFGSTQGIETIVENEYTIRTTTPTAYEYGGSVDVYVIRGDGRKTVLRPGFRYAGIVTVTSVTPSAGPTSGGTPITISGQGFSPDSDVIVDGRSTIDVRRISDSTILAITPPGQAGQVEVLVLSGSGKGRLGRSFRYVDTPSDIVCSPFVVNAAGSDDGGPVQITVTGTNLGSIEAISISSGTVTSRTIESDTSISFTADFSGSGGNGPVDVSLVGPAGTVLVHACFTALDLQDIDNPALRIWAVVPHTSRQTGGIEARLAVTGLDFGNPESLLVRLGSIPVSVSEVPDINTVKFIIPAGNPGTVDVTLESPGESDTFTDGFTWLKDARIDTIEPAAAPPEGGIDATITGAGLADVVDVLIGPLPAVITADPTDTSLQIRIPPVGPGVHDVTAIFRDGSSVKKTGALTCSSDTLMAKVVTPDRGSMSGGTLVYVTGSGLVEGTRVFFGNYEATAAVSGDPGRLAVFSPAADEEGPVDIFVVGPDGIRQRLDNAFYYFNPTGFLGGTWGPAISGSVNVTVIDSYYDSPISQAFVMLGSEALTTDKGFTDGRGMVTISRRDLTGPLMVSATRQDYTTWSIVGVDAENITIYLEPLYTPIPPDDGSGNGEYVFPPSPGTVTGKVLGTDKEFILPASNCQGMPLVNGSTCRSCLVDSQCDTGSVCIMSGPTFLTCSKPCLTVDDCPSGYNCYQTDEQGTVCKPSPGTAEVRCGISNTSTSSWGDNPGPGAIMTSAGTFAMNSRLGDVAVYCVGGFKKPSDGSFVPVIMGLLRHVYVGTSSISAGNNVRLNIPLDRTLRVRMIAPPGGAGGPNVHVTGLAMELGSDGFLNLWDSITSTDGNIFDFKSMPRDMTGPLEGTSVIFSTEATSPSSTGEPYSVASAEAWTPFKTEPVRVFQDSTGTPEIVSELDVKAGCSSGSAGIVIDTDGRAWTVDSYGLVTALPIFGNSEINGCVRTYDGRVLFTGNSSRIYFFDPATFQWTAEAVSTDKIDLTAAAASDDGIFWVIGTNRLYVRPLSGIWKRLDYGSPAPLFDVKFTGGGKIVGVGAKGTIITADENVASVIKPSPTSTDLYSVTATAGKITATGRRGLILTGESAAALTEVESGVLDDLTVSVADHNGEVIIGGSRGLIIRLGNDGPKVIREPSGKGEISSLIDITSGAEGTEDPGTSVPILAFSRSSVTAGPFMNILEFSSPPKNWLWLDRTLTWSIKEPPAPSFFYIRLYTVNEKGRWSILAAGDTRSIKLPDLDVASGMDIRPLKSGTVSLKYYSIMSPDFDIDNYDSSSLYTSRWSSWSTGGLLTKFTSIF